MDQLQQQRYNLLEVHAQTCADIEAVTSRKRNLEAKATALLQDVRDVTAKINTILQQQKEATVNGSPEKAEGNRP